MSPKVVTARLRLVGELWRLSVALQKAQKVNSRKTAKQVGNKKFSRV